MTQSHRPAAPMGRAPRRRAFRSRMALLLAATTSLGGCYTYSPVVSTPAPGASLVLDLNDRGRVVLGDSIGPSAATVEGVVQGVQDSLYLMRVSSVRYLNGQANQWSGEPLSVRADLIGRARQRNYSRARTWALGIGAAVAVLAVVLSTDLLGGPEPPAKSGNPPPPNGQ